MVKINAPRARPKGSSVKLHPYCDLYTIVGMMTQTEHAQAVEHGRQFRTDSHVAIAGQAVATDWASPTSLGILRLREH
jgi:hypothetical protein